MKNRVTVTIAGQEYTLVGTEAVSYTHLDVYKRQALNNEIDPKRANTLLYACNAALAAIKTDEYEKKLVELEGLLSTMEGR